MTTCRQLPSVSLTFKFYNLCLQSARLRIVLIAAKVLGPLGWCWVPGVKMASSLQQCLIKKWVLGCILASGILIYLFNFDFKDLGWLHFLSAKWRKLLVNRSINFHSRVALLSALSQSSCAFTRASSVCIGTSVGIGILQISMRVTSGQGLQRRGRIPKGRGSRWNYGRTLFFLPGSEKYPDDLQRWWLPAKANFVISLWLLRSLLAILLMSVDKSSLFYSYKLGLPRLFPSGSEK